MDRPQIDSGPSPTRAFPEQPNLFDRGEIVKKKSFLRIPQMLLVVAATIGFCQQAGAAPQVVWQIGRFDRSSSEFNLRGAPAPKPGAGKAQSDLVYVIGKSTAGTDRPAFPFDEPGWKPGQSVSAWLLPMT